MPGRPADGGGVVGHDGRVSDALHLAVTDNREHERYEVRTDDGRFAGFAAYWVRDDRVVFIHTVVKEEFEGKGVGSFLASHALDDVRSRGLRVVAVCPFIHAYVERHHEYDDLVVPARPEDLDPDA